MLTWLEKHMLPCAYKTVFGIDCPLCGFQRSLLFLLWGVLFCCLVMYTSLLFVLALLFLFVLYLIIPRLVNKKNCYRYAMFVLVVIGINYAAKLAILFV